MLSFNQFIILIAVTAGGIALAYVGDMPLAAGFSAGLVTLVFFTLRAGVDFSVVLRAMRDGIIQTKEVLWILLLVGLLIPALMVSGTIPLMIELGLSLMVPGYFVTSAFIVTGVISMLLGTAIGSLSTVGIPIIGVAAVLGIPLPLVAGALVSGAFIGDRTSPFSSINRLVASSTGISIRENMTAIAPTTVAAIGVSLLFFLTADLIGQWAAAGKAAAGIAAQVEVGSRFPLLLPPVLLIAGMLLRLRTQYVFLSAIVVSIVLGTFYQGVAPGDWVNYLVFGCDSAVAAQKAKGLASMFWLIVLIFLAGAFNGILDKTKSIRSYLHIVMGTSLSLTAATVRTALFGLVLSVLFCSQTLPIMIAGGNLRSLWAARFPKTELARVVADSALVYAGMIPWSMLAIICASILQVDVLEYVAYAVFLWALPLLTVLKSYWQDKAGGTNRSHVA